MNKINKKLLTYAVLPMLGLGLFAGTGVASAHSFFGSNATPEEMATRQQALFNNQATLLGVTVEEVKNAWAAGKTLQDLAKEKGMTPDQLKQKMKDARLAELKAGLQMLVSRGVITQAQADQRLQSVQARFQNAKPRKMGMMHGFDDF